MKLRLAHWNQLASYIKQAEADGWYYGNRKQFDKRHKELADWVWVQADLANKREFKEGE